METLERNGKSGASPSDWGRKTLKKEQGKLGCMRTAGWRDIILGFDHNV